MTPNEGPGQDPGRSRDVDEPVGQQDDPDALLKQVEGDLTTLEFPSKRAALFKRAAELFRSQGRDAEARRSAMKAALFDFMLVPRNEQRSRYGRFAPMIEMGGKAYPHVDAFTPEDLLTIREELERSANPIHRALYADFLWDRRERYPGPRREAVTAARTAVDSYLEAARQYRKNEWDDQLADALDRAAELSLLLRDGARIERSKERCFEVVEELVRAQRHPPVRWAIDVLKTLQKHDRHLTRQERELVISLAEAGASFYASEGIAHLQRSFLDLLPASHRAVGNMDAAKGALIRRAETFVAEADATQSGLAKLHFYSEAVAAYQQLGQAERVDELKRRLSDAGVQASSEMHPITAEVRVPTAVAEAWVNRLMTLELEQALEAIASSMRFFPKVEMIRDDAARQRERHPLQYLVSRRTLDSEGRIVQAALSADEQVAASESDSYRLAIAIADWELGLAFDRLEAEKGMDAEGLMRFLRSRPIFEPATLDAVAVGAERYFADDQVSALYVLVPQLEETLRDILAKLDIARTSVQQGLTREKPLDVVLSTPELRTGLGEDLASFLERFLIRPETQNLRNRVAHGLMEVEHCTRELTRRVILCYLQLGNLQVVHTGASVDGAPPTDT